MKKLEVGQTIYLKAVGNEARYHDGLYYKEATIDKLGRKYITVGSFQFEIEEGYREKSDYSARWEFYFSEQEILDEEESKRLYRDIQSSLSSYGKPKQSLDQLRRIKAVLDEDKAIKD